MASKSLAGFLLTVFVCFNFSGCGRSGNTGSSGTSGGSVPSTEVLYARGLVDLMAFSLNQSDAKLTLGQKTAPLGNTTQLLDNPPVIVSSSAHKLLYIIDPLANGIEAYSVSSDGTLAAVTDSPFLVPQSISGSPELSSLISSPSGKYLYALDQSGSIIQAQIDASTGAVNFTSISSSAGSLVRSAAIDPSGASIYVSAGIAGFTSTGDYAGLSAFSVDPTTGQVSPIPGSPYRLPSNSQPCQVVVDPSGRNVYATLYNLDAIAAFTRDTSTGSLTAVVGSPFPTPRSPSQTCDIAVHPSAKFLYAFDLNGHDIAGYSIDSSTGALTPLAGSPFPGQPTPDEFHLGSTQGPMAIDPSGKFLFVLTSGTSYIAVYSINQNSGALSVSGSPQVMPEPVTALNIFRVN